MLDMMAMASYDVLVVMMATMTEVMYPFASKFASRYSQATTWKWGSRAAATPADVTLMPTLARLLQARQPT